MPTRRRRVAVRGTRGIGPADLLRNSRTGAVDVDQRTGLVTLDGEPLRSEPGRVRLPQPPLLPRERTPRHDRLPPTASACPPSGPRTSAPGWRGRARAPTFDDPDDLAAARAPGRRSPRAVRRFEPVTMVSAPDSRRAPRRPARPGRRARSSASWTTPGCATSARPSSPTRTARTGRRRLDVQRLGRPGLGPLGARREDRRVRSRTSPGARTLRLAAGQRGRRRSTSTARARSCSPRRSSSARSATRAGRGSRSRRRSTPCSAPARRSGCRAA